MAGSHSLPSAMESQKLSGHYVPAVCVQRILLLRNNPASVSSATSEAERKCRDICIKSARDTIHLVDEFLQFQQEPSSVAVWYALYFLFQAALIPIICISSEPTSEHARAWVQDVERTKQILLSLNRQNKLAARFYDVLERLLSQYVYVNANLGEDSNGTAALGGNGGVAGLDDPQAWMSRISRRWYLTCMAPGPSRLNSLMNPSSCRFVPIVFFSPSRKRLRPVCEVFIHFKLLYVHYIFSVVILFYKYL